MFLSTFSRAAIPAAVLAGLVALPLDAQTTVSNDNASDRSGVFWLSTASFTSAAVFVTFLDLNHASAALRAPTQVSVPRGTTGAPVLLAASGTSSTSGTSGSNLFVAAPSPLGAAVTASATPNATTTPEPSSLALFATGIVGLVPLARRRRR